MYIRKSINSTTARDPKDIDTKPQTVIKTLKESIMIQFIWKTREKKKKKVVKVKCIQYGKH